MEPVGMGQDRLEGENVALTGEPESAAVIRRGPPPRPRLEIEGFPGAQLVKKSACSVRPLFEPSVREIPWGRDGLPTPVVLGFPGGLDSKGCTCNAGDVGSVPG